MRQFWMDNNFFLNRNLFYTRGPCVFFWERGRIVIGFQGVEQLSAAVRNLVPIGFEKMC